MICTEAFFKNLVVLNDPQSQASLSSWVKVGFGTWKNAKTRINNHSRSSLHRESAEALSNLSKVNVYQHVSDSVKKQMMDNRLALRQIFNTIKLLGQQGLALRGHGNDDKSNFMRILNSQAENVDVLKTWLQRTGHKWLHHDIQDEILDLIATKVISDHLSEIRNADFYAILLDETSDYSRMEQVSVCFRIVSEDLVSSEYFLGFYATASTTAEALCSLVKDVLLRFNLPIEKLRGQCYDGASNVAGNLSGLQTRIREIEKRALFVHCKSHNLNLCVQDALELVFVARKFIGLVKDLINFVRDSPKRVAEFQEIQENNEKDEKNQL